MHYDIINVSNYCLNDFCHYGDQVVYYFKVWSRDDTQVTEWLYLSAHLWCLTPVVEHSLIRRCLVSVRYFCWHVIILVKCLSFGWLIFRQYCTMIDQCWSVTMQRLRGRFFCPISAMPGFRILTTASLRDFDFLSLRPFWPPILSSTLNFCLSSIQRLDSICFHCFT